MLLVLRSLIIDDANSGALAPISRFSYGYTVLGVKVNLEREKVTYKVGV